MKAFQPRSLEHAYEALDRVPEGLVAPLVTLPVGRLSERVEGLLAWRTALLAGRLPELDSWPAALSAPSREGLIALGLARYCRGQPDLVDEVLADLLSAWRGLRQRHADRLRARLSELEALERERLAALEEPRALREDDTRRLEGEARADAEELLRGTDAELVARWEKRVRLWSELSAVFDELGALLGRGRDLSHAILRHTGWAEVLRLRSLLQQLDPIRAVIAGLGRLQEDPDGEMEETLTETLFEPMTRWEEQLREVPTPSVPEETRGVCRAGEINRMLPAEAALLGHPKLRMLWHARRAERALLTYRVEGVDHERVWVEREEPVGLERDRRAPRPQRGPILALIDTSGSMHGLPETVAKALVLEAMRTATRERRRCFLVAFSGPGQTETLELDLSAEGIGSLLEFLGRSFHGGTDLHAPLKTALDKLGEEGWARADVLLVSDGEFSTPSALMPRVDQQKEEGTRFHGVQIGNRGRTGLHAVCEPVHRFSDWAALAARPSGG